MIILKLDSLDDFQKVQGFLYCLDNEYKSKLRTQYPKTLEDTMSFARVYDDNINNSSNASTWEKTFASNYLSSKNGKCKFSKEEDDKKDHDKITLSSDVQGGRDEHSLVMMNLRVQDVRNV